MNKILITILLLSIMNISLISAIPIVEKTNYNFNHGVCNFVYDVSAEFEAKIIENNNGFLIKSKTGNIFIDGKEYPIKIKSYEPSNYHQRYGVEVWVFPIEVRIKDNIYRGEIRWMELPEGFTLFLLEFGNNDFSCSNLMGGVK